MSWFARFHLVCSSFPSDTLFSNSWSTCAEHTRSTLQRTARSEDRPTSPNRMSTILSFLRADPAFSGIGSLFEEKHVVNAGKAHKKTPAQVLLRWSTQRGIAVIPKSNHAERLLENLDCSDFDLSEPEVKVRTLHSVGRRSVDAGN